MLNEWQSGHPINVSIVFYNTVIHVLRFGSPFDMFSCSVVGRYAVSWLQASKPDEERERERKKTRSSGMGL